MKTYSPVSIFRWIGQLSFRIVASTSLLIATLTPEAEASFEVCCDNSCLPALDSRFLSYCDVGPIKSDGSYFCPDNTSRILALISEYNRLEASGCVTDECLRRLYEINEEIERLAAEGRKCTTTTTPPSQWIDFGQLMTECWNIIQDTQGRFQKYCQANRNSRIDR